MGETMYNNAHIYDRFQTLETSESMAYEVLFIDRAHILELACGTGRLHSAFSDHKYFGIDISIPMLTKFKKRDINTNLICADVSRLPIKFKFDAIVLSLNSIHHLNDQQVIDLVKEIDRVSTSNCILLIEMTDFSLIPWVNNQYENEYYEYNNNSGLLLKQRITKHDDIFSFERSYYKAEKLEYEEQSTLYAHSPEQVSVYLSKINFKRVKSNETPNTGGDIPTDSLKKYIFIKEI
jgi:SAM-dependent methyltransferase